MKKKGDKPKHLRGLGNPAEPLKCGRCKVATIFPLRDLAALDGWAYLHFLTEGKGWQAHTLCPDCSSALEAWLAEGG